MAGQLMLVCPYAHVWESISECRLWVYPHQSRRTPHVLFILLWLFIRWVVDGQKAVALWGISFRNCSKHPIAFLCTSYLAFSQTVLSVSMLCNDITTATAWKKSYFILSLISDFHMIAYLTIAVHTFTWCILTSFSVDEILLPRYVNWSTKFRGWSLKVIFTGSGQLLV